jgi:hypothetical protein
MIVVVGLAAYSATLDGLGSAAGLAVDVAAEAVRQGATVELVGKIGDDGKGEAVVLGLGRLGIGHAALLRDPARPTPVLVVEAIGVDAEEGADAGAAELTGLEVDDSPVVTLLPAEAGERPGLEAGDVQLALRYLAEARVVVVADRLGEPAIAAAVEGAQFAAARLVVLVPAGSASPAVPTEATVLEAPPADDGSFGRVVGAFAAALDSGLDAEAAFGRAVERSGWEAVAD